MANGNKGQGGVEGDAAPMIVAGCHSDDRLGVARFDAAPFFEQASDEDIVALAGCDWAGDYPADRVALFFDERVAEVSFILEYCRRKMDMGFEAWVDATTAVAWLKSNRPELLEKLVAAGHCAPVVELKTFLVRYRQKAQGQQFFRCRAEDADHAREQCANAYPNAFLLETVRSTEGDEPTPMAHAPAAGPGIQGASAPAGQAADPLETSDDDLRSRLRQANKKFKNAGGRGVELADFIDAARRELRRRTQRRRATARKAVPMGRRDERKGQG